MKTYILLSQNQCERCDNSHWATPTCVMRHLQDNCWPEQNTHNTQAQIIRCITHAFKINVTNCSQIVCLQSRWLAKVELDRGMHQQTARRLRAVPYEPCIKHKRRHIDRLQQLFSRHSNTSALQAALDGH